MRDSRPTKAIGSPVSAQLRILETTDLHVHILPHDYFTDRPAPGGGLAQLASLIRQKRKAVQNSCLFDNGDFLQGTPLSDWAAQEPWAVPHPMMAAMNSLGYDGGTLGNHEFNYGLTFLGHVLGQAQFPVVSSNITLSQGETPNKDTTLVAPWAILKQSIKDTEGIEHCLRLGIIGFAPPQIPLWDRYTDGPKVGTRDIIEAAKHHVPVLRKNGADIVIALCHAGIAEENHKAGMENAAVPLAAVAGIDVVLMGHTHQIFPASDAPMSPVIDGSRGTLHGKPAVMAGFHGMHLGVVDLGLVRDAAGWRIVDHVCRVLKVPKEVEPDRAIVQSVQAAHEEVLKSVRAPLVKTDGPLTSHFAMVAPSAPLTLLSDALISAAGPIQERLGLTDLPLLTAVAPYKAGGGKQPANYVHVGTGILEMRHASDLYPFPNDLCLLRLSGKNLKSWLEHAAEAFCTITVGQTDQPLLNPDFASYDFDVVHGVRYEIDPSAPVGRRITGLRHRNGATLQQDDGVLLVTNGYRAAGGGGYEMAQSAEFIHHEQISLREILIAYLRQQETLTPRAAPVWRFAQLPGTSAWFESAAAGADFLHLPEHQHMHHDRKGRHGFHRFVCDLNRPAHVSNAL